MDGSRVLGLLRRMNVVETIPSLARLLLPPGVEDGSESGTGW